MVFEKEINFLDCNYIYIISLNIKKYILCDIIFI